VSSVAEITIPAKKAIGGEHMKFLAGLSELMSRRFLRHSGCRVGGNRELSASSRPRPFIGKGIDELFPLIFNIL
jgi:hypothetical protein